MGYSADAPLERAYRDSRINRIFEGTNEINRMLMVGMLLKRAMKGEINLFEPAMAVSAELTSVPSFETVDTSELFAAEKETIKKLKKVFLMVGGKAAMALADKIESEQEVMMNLADLMIEIYAAESVILRTEKLVGLRGEEACQPQIAMTQVYLFEAVEKIQTAAKEAIAAFTKGDEQKVMLMGLKEPLPLDSHVQLTLMFEDAKGVKSQQELHLMTTQNAPGATGKPADAHHNH